MNPFGRTIRNYTYIFRSPTTNDSKTRYFIFNFENSIDMYFKDLQFEHSLNPYKLVNFQIKSNPTNKIKKK